MDSGTRMSWQGHGIALGKALIAVTPGRLKAHIKPQNIASRKIAEAVGMMLDGETEEIDSTISGILSRLSLSRAERVCS